MPKSKRSKKVSLTKTDSKGKEAKKDLIETIREALDSYDYIYVLTYSNMRATHFKDVRADWNDSRFFLGKNKVMQLALGKSKEDEMKDNLHELSELISGNCALLLTARELEETQEYFNALSHKDYARSGFTATETITLPAGELKDKPHSMLEEFRKLGLPVDLNKGIIVLRKDYTVCKLGQVLTPEQCRILKHFDISLAEFKLSVKAVYHDGAVSVFDVEGEGGEGDGEAEGDMEEEEEDAF